MLHVNHNIHRENLLVKLKDYCSCRFFYCRVDNCRDGDILQERGGAAF